MSKQGRVKQKSRKAETKGNKQKKRAKGGADVSKQNNPNVRLLPKPGTKWDPKTQKWVEKPKWEPKKYEAKKPDPDRWPNRVPSVLPHASVLCDEAVRVATGDIMQMLQYKRPDNSITEKTFIERYLMAIVNVDNVIMRPTVDKFGNLWFFVGETSPILWSSHTDTVHFTPGLQRVKQNRGLIRLGHTELECLGADCTAGVWIMREMIKRNIPGIYIFHRAEERGGVGSRWIADNVPQLLNETNFAIAFDRRGYRDIIRTQFGGACCSDEFANSLAAALPHPARWLLNNGTFTDTAHYTHIIPECTNISVGYEGQHTSKERLDMNHLVWLLERVTTMNVDNLICHREPSKFQRAKPVRPRRGAALHTTRTTKTPKKDDADEKHAHRVAANGYADGEDATSYRNGRAYSKGWYPFNDPFGFDNLEWDPVEKAWVDVDDDHPTDGTLEDMSELVSMNPEIIADYLLDLGLSVDDMADHVYEFGGALKPHRFDAASQRFKRNGNDHS